MAARYNRLAAHYDRRWSSYLGRTLGQACDALRLTGHERLLDVGCGTGEFARLALARFPHLEIVGVDVAPGMLAVAARKFAGRPQSRLVLARAERLPFEREVFDAVVCANILHHVASPEAVLQECARVLRHGGRLVVVAWCRDGWRGRLLHAWLQLMNRREVTMCRLCDVLEMLRSLGASVEQADTFLAPPCYGMLRVVARINGATAP